MGENLSWALERAVMVSGDQIGVIDGDRRMTYVDLHRRVASFGGGLAELGVERGDVVAVLSLNSLGHLECWFGITRHGAVLNDLNYRLSPAELAFIVDDCASKVLMVDDAHADVGRQLVEGSGTLKHLVHIGTGPTPAGAIGYDELLAANPEPAADLGGSDLAGIFYTGGTTGLPKGVMLTHDNLVENAKHTLLAQGHVRTDRYLHAAPMFHLADGGQMFAQTWVGGTHVIIPQFDPGAVLDAIEHERITRTVLVPTMINMVVHHPGASSRDLSSLAQVLYGASPMPSELQRKAVELLPTCDWVQGYGATETSPLVTILSGEEHRRGLAGEEPHASRLRSAGRPVVGVQAQIRTLDGEPAPVGEVGEIWVRGKNIMAGYWNRPQETAAALTEDGWYRSGDMAYADDGGYIFIVDRAKDMIISGGENIYSTEVENAIYQHPAVIEAAVIGVPDERWGERVHAVIVIAESSTLTTAEIMAHCKERIAGFKVPRSVDIRHEALPKSGAGKILKRDLREPFWAEHQRSVN